MRIHLPQEGEAWDLSLEDLGVFLLLPQGREQRERLRPGHWTPGVRIEDWGGAGRHWASCPGLASI